MKHRAWRRQVLAGIVGIGVALGPAQAAAADPPRPTNYRSTITAATSELPEGVTVQVVGGDAFLELRVRDGHEVIVPDYPGSDGEAVAPYLRFRADGTVERNRRAAATAANETRYGAADTTPDPSADPDWEVVATNGTYAWHDHRIHWMSPNEPRAVDDGGRVDLGGPGGAWEVPIVVDGTPITIIGELVLIDPPSPLAWVVAGVLAAAATIALGARWGLSAASAIAVAVSSAAVGVGWATWASAPDDVGASLIPVVVPAAALVASVVGCWGPDRSRLVASAAAAAALVGWSLTRTAVLTRAVLPTTLPFGLDRATTALALGVGVGLAVVLAWKPPVRASQTA